MSSSAIPVPSSGGEITPEWVQKVTGHETIQEGFHIEGDIQEGCGFLSSICRVGYKTKSGDSHQIIVKLLPTNPKWLEFALADASDEREILFYSLVVPDLIKEIPEIQENICIVYNGTIRDADAASGKAKASILVMEDLKPPGFRMMDFAGDAQGKVLPSLITFMARYHFGVLAVEVRKGVSLKQLYPFMQGVTVNPEWHAQMQTLCDDGYRQLEELLKTQNMPPEIWESYSKLKPYTAKMVKKVDEEGGKHPCLVHTDIWPNNIMIHDSLPVKVLDWQLLGYRDVTYDLIIMLFTVLTQETLTKANLREQIRRYYDEFEELCQSRGYGDKIKRRSWEEFEEFFFTWGVAFGYMIFLPSIECYAKNYAKYTNVFRVICEEISLPEFLEKACS